MAAQASNTRGRLACTAGVEPQPADAGARVTVSVCVTATPPCDLEGHRLHILGDGAEAGTIALGAFDGNGNAGEATVAAPRTTGAHAWTVVSPAITRNGVVFDEAATPLPLAVVAHATRVLAWDVPPAVVAGEDFALTVGIKCSQSCDLTGRRFAIHDAAGRERAAAALSHECLQGSDGLHIARLTLRAPDSEGLYDWQVRSAVTDAGLPHAEGTAVFGLRVVRAPEAVVRIEAIDAASGAPLAGAGVALHPYKATTDAEGRAELRVARGAYRLFVSRRGYVTFAQPLDATADATVRSALAPAPKPERN